MCVASGAVTYLPSKAEVCPGSSLIPAQSTELCAWQTPGTCVQSEDKDATDVSVSHPEIPAEETHIRIWFQDVLEVERGLGHVCF